MSYSYLRGLAAVALILSAIFTAGMALALWCWLFAWDWQAMAGSFLLLVFFTLIGFGSLRAPVPYNGIGMADDDEDVEWNAW